LADASTDATLSTLSISTGTLNPTFDASTTTYNVSLPSGTTDIPTVTATVNESHASEVIADATALPGSATVTVTAQDGSTKVYTINYTVEIPTGVNLTSATAKVYASNASITVEGNAGANVSVANLAGSTLYSGVVSSTKEILPVSFQTGVYVVRVNGVATKVIVK